MTSKPIPVARVIIEYRILRADGWLEGHTMKLYKDFVEDCVEIPQIVANCVKRDMEEIMVRAVPPRKERNENNKVR